MRLFTRTYLQGMHDGLVDHGVMRPFPSDDAAVAVFDKLAEDAGLPPILEAQLSKEAALPIAERMKATSDKLASDGAGPNAKRIAMAKQASLYDLGARASVAASFYMEKAANEGSLTPNNENTLANAAKDDQLAKVDNTNRPEGTYHTPRGETDLPVPGVVGREVPAPHAPTTGTTVKAATGAMTLGSGLQGLIDHIRQSRIMTNPSQSLRTVANATQDMAAMKQHPEAGMPRIIEEFAQRQAARNHALGTLGMQAGAGVAGLGALGAAGAGVHHLMSQGQPGAEDMEVTASEVAPLNRALTFLVGLHNKTAGTWVPSEEAKVAAAGLGAAGAPGLEAMSTILSRVKTAYDAESELHQILQVLDAQGIPPSPELVQALAQALGEGDENGGGAPPAGPPSGDDKTAAMEQMTLGLSNADKARNHGVRAAKTLSDAAKAHPQAVGAGKALAGVAGLAAIAAGAKKLHDHVKGEGGDKEAADAFWADILKAAGEGSLTPNDENTLANAAKDDQLAKVDQKNRAEGKYKKPQGQTDLSTEAGEVGAEKAAEEAYLANLRKTAADWGSKLPASMPIEKKREEIAKIASLAPSQRAAYVDSLQS